MRLAIALLVAVCLRLGTCQNFAVKGYVPPKDESNPNHPGLIACEGVNVKYVSTISKATTSTTYTNTKFVSSTRLNRITSTKVDVVYKTLWQAAPAQPAQTTTEYIATVAWSSLTSYATAVLPQQTLTSYESELQPATSVVTARDYQFRVTTLRQVNTNVQVVTTTRWLSLTSLQYQLSTVTDTIEQPIKTAIERVTTTVYDRRTSRLPIQTVTKVLTRTQTLTETRLVQPPVSNVDVTVTVYTSTTSSTNIYRYRTSTVYNNMISLYASTSVQPVTFVTYSVKENTERKLLDHTNVNFVYNYDTVVNTQYKTSVYQTRLVLPDQTFTQMQLFHTTSTQLNAGKIRFSTTVSYNEHGRHTVTLTNIADMATITSYINQMKCTSTLTYDYAEPQTRRPY